MALLDQKIIASEVAERQDFTPLPAGKYTAMVVDSQIKPTRAGNGSILVLQFEIQDGPFSNRKIFENLNIRNPNEIAQRIAHESLAELCRALGKETLTDSEELHGKRVVIDVAVEVAKPTTTYPDPKPQNVIKKYINPNSAQTNSNNQAAQQPASGTAEAGETVPRWKRQS